MYVCIFWLDSTSFNLAYLPRRHTASVCNYTTSNMNSHINSHPFFSVSAKGFYKEQPVIDFVCETLGRGVTPQSLENRNFRFEKPRFEKAIRGKNA